MSLGRMPIFAWAMLAMGGMVIFAFPPLILGTLLLELERAFGWPFFIAQHGGDPLLWQHLFWFFGHPDVYIIFLPAAGMVSMIVATMARTPLVGYRWVVGAIFSMAGLSFALWVHHMFAAGLSVQAMHVFSAASMAIVIPSAIQVFAWLATLRRGRVRLATPMLFLLGFFVIFTIGGLTGIMLAVLPFDWQAHDTHFVVAHLHYVLIGGLLFPLFAGFYYWAPTASGRPLSDRLGRWVCGLLFTGVHVTFLPMHLTGLLGMPRRVYTYPSGLGLEWTNLVSSVGSVLIAAGVALFLVDVCRHLRLADKIDVNPWDAGTLEWLPLGHYGARSIPLVESREPLWDRPSLRDEVDRGEHLLPGTATGRRETLVTTWALARPEYVAILPGPGWPPVLAAIGTAAFFLLLTVQLTGPAIVGGVLALTMILMWAWGTDPGPVVGPVEVARGVWLPTYMTGRRAHSWWAMMVVIAVLGTTFASLVFSYAYLWLVGPEDWPPAGAGRPSGHWPAMATVAWLGSSGLVVGASRALAAGATGRFRMWLGLGLTLVLLAIALDGVSQLRAGLAPDRHAYEATVATFIGVQAVTAAAVLIMALYTLVRSWCGLLDRTRRVTLDNTMLLWQYTVAQGVVALGLVHLIPWIVW
jgi:cytochrome c oxidase subunit I+III